MNPDAVQAEAVQAEARACHHCAGLPLGPRPIFRVGAASRVLLLSQAPSTGAHETGRPWIDASGERLRSWLGLDEATFHSDRIAILPVGLCYPGRLPAGGDAPPRPECAPLWHPRLLALMPGLRLTVLIGGAAQALRLGPGRMTDRVRDWAAHGPALFPIPHPSWRTAVWERRNPWFPEAVVPALQAAVRRALAG